jgi:hypothetical protein
MQIMNGVVKQSVGVSYLIKPTSTGTFTIGEASVKVNGKLLHSNKLTLKVTNSPSPGKNNPERNNPGNNKNTNDSSINTNQNFTFISPSKSYNILKLPISK